MSSKTPPGNPQLTSVPQLLSPVSPKPLHFPAPSNIPVLENQIDLDFNQTTTHMSTPADQQAHVATEHIATAPDGNRHVQVTNGEGAGTGDGSSQRDESLQIHIPSMAGVSQLNPEHTIYAQATPTQSDAPVAQSSEKASHADIHSTLGALHTSSNSQTLSDVHETTVHTPAQDVSNVIPKESQFQLAPRAGIDYQALLDTLSYTSAVPPPETNNASSILNAAPIGQPPAPGTTQSPPGFASTVTGLPPRPPPQAQPAIHPNYTQSSDIRNYHPHAQNPAVQPHTQQSTYHSGTQNQPYPGAPQAPGVVASNNGLPPPPLASFQQPQVLAMPPGTTQSPTTLQKMQQRAALESQRERKQAAGELLDEDDIPWTAETQKLYEQFLTEERNYVTEGNWEQFPYGSRLFVGPYRAP